MYYVQKQPSRGIFGKNVLKICTKLTGKHPCQNLNEYQSQVQELYYDNTVCYEINRYQIFTTNLHFKKNKARFEYIFIFELYHSKLGLNCERVHQRGTYPLLTLNHRLLLEVKMILTKTLFPTFLSHMLITNFSAGYAMKFFTKNLLYTLLQEVVNFMVFHL